MLLRELLASCITFFRTRLITFYHNIQRMLDSVHHITESSESNNNNNNDKKKNVLKHTHLAIQVSHVSDFLPRNT